jgi:type I restriction enzyme M protein
VWFYDMQADGWSLDDKRQPLLDTSLLGLHPFADGRKQLSKAEHAKNNLPDVLERWGQRNGTERDRPRTAQSFCVPKADIEANGYPPSCRTSKPLKPPTAAPGRARCAVCLAAAAGVCGGVVIQVSPCTQEP